MINTYVRNLVKTLLCIMISLVLSIFIYTLALFHTVDIIRHWKETGYSFTQYIHIILLAFIFFNGLMLKFNPNFSMKERDIFQSFGSILKNICEQLQDVKFLIGVIVLFVAVYGYQISNFTLSIDEELQMFQAKNSLQWCYEGRFSIAILKSIFMESGMFPPYLSTFIAGILMTFSGLTICLLFTEKLMSPPGLFEKLIFLAGYLSFPSVFIETLSFSTYCIEISFGMFLVSFSVLLLDYYHTTRKRPYLIANILIMIFALGIYQAMVNVYITTIIIYYLLSIYAEPNITWQRLWQYLKRIFFTIVILLISLAGFYFIYKAATFIHRMDSSIDYINGFSGWSADLSIGESLRYSFIGLGNVMSMYEIPGIRYFYYYLMIGLMTAIFLLIINHNLKGITCCLLMIIALLSSFLMWVALASEYLPFRVWLAVPVICGFTYFFTIYCIRNSNWRMIPAISSFVILVILFRQIQTATQLSFSDHTRMGMDLSYAQEIYNDICFEFGSPSQETPIVFIGTNDVAQNSTVIQNPPSSKYWGGNSLGYSLWHRAQEPWRMKGLYAYLGYDLTFEVCTEPEIIEYIRTHLNVFPQKGSMILWDNKIYVRLD